jgi:RND family efflux transporter MFP subunit
MHHTITSEEPPSAAPHKEHVSAAAPTAAAKGSAWGWIIFLLIFGAIIGLGVAYMIHSRRAHEVDLRQTALESAALPVNVVHPQPITTTEEIRLPGSAQAFQDTPIYARTSGYLKKWNVDIGSHVKQGDVLAEIETPEVDRQLEQALADEKNAQANLQLAQITATRAEDLIKRNTISRQEHDQAVSDLAAKRALVEAGSANVKRLEQLQSFQKVYAPFDGVITARNTDVGALIQGGDNSSARELFHLADNHILRVYFSVPEVYAAGVKAGAQTPITFDAFPGENFTGTIVRDAAAIDPKSHTLTVEADVENPSGRLFPGGYTNVHLKLPGTTGAVTIPANTLLFRAEGPRVAVVRNSKIALVPITIGRDHGNTVEVVSTVKPADQLVLDPPDSLSEGTPVSVENEKQAN